MATEETTRNNIAAYREYAKQGILAASAINSGALIAALASFEHLAKQEGIGAAFIFWTFGLAVATFCWLAAYLANDGYSKGRSRQDAIWSRIGIACLCASISFFCIGGWLVSRAFSGLIVQ